MTYTEHILLMISIYIALSSTLNLVSGLAGLPSLCHAAFYGIGAYAFTLLSLRAGFGFPLAMIGAVVICGVLSPLVALPSLRLKPDYFVLATLAFQVIVFVVLYNWVGLTNGSYGLSGIPAPALLGHTLQVGKGFLILGLALNGAVSFLIWMLSKSPYGRLLRSIREDELAARSLGRNAAAGKLSAFVIASALAAVPGCIFATYTGFIDPTSFTLNESMFVLAIVIIGGSGGVYGPIVGSVLLVTLPELLRYLTVPDAIAGNVRQIVYGVLLILTMRFRPQGLLGDFRYD